MLKTSWLCIAAMLLPLPVIASASTSAAYPAIPEPMVFDMMRPLGAAAGEVEVNTLMMAPLSGDPRDIGWAPEIEYAFADGLAIEFELPFVNSRLDEYKLGLQAAFGSFNEGRSAHGLQYLAVYARDDGHYSGSLLYMLGHRYDAHWSSMSMIGVGSISLNGGQQRNDAAQSRAVLECAGHHAGPGDQLP